MNTEHDDYLEDARGNRIKKTNIKPVDLCRHELVRELISDGLEVAGIVRAFKGKAFREIQSFAELSAEQYGVKWGGKKGNITLSSFDGRYRIMLARQDNIQFTEQLGTAQQLIMECFDEWTEGSRDEVRLLIHEAFKTNKAGQVSTGKVLGLLRLDIKHPKWDEAMKAIRDSIQVAGSAAYIRLYERVGDGDQYRQIALDGSSALSEEEVES